MQKEVPSAKTDKCDHGKEFDWLFTIQLVFIKPLSIQLVSFQPVKLEKGNKKNNLNFVDQLFRGNNPSLVNNLEHIEAGRQIIEVQGYFTFVDV